MPLKMTKSLIVIVLDESDSLKEKKSEIISGFNTFIDVQRKVEGDLGRVILIKFNSRVYLSRNCHSLESIPHLTDETYKPYGRTALNDSVVYGMQLADKTQEKDETVMFVIITDGQENASVRTNGQQMNEMIKARNKKNGWNFFYIGVDPTDWSRKSGMDVCDCVQFDGSTPENSFRKAEEATLGVRSKADTREKGDKKDTNRQFVPLFPGVFGEFRDLESKEKVKSEKNSMTLETGGYEVKIQPIEEPLPTIPCEAGCCCGYEQLNIII